MIIKHLLLLTSLTYTILASVNPTMYTYKQVGDLPLRAAVYIPPVRVHKLYPVIFALHQGGLMFNQAQDALSKRELNEMLQRGWAVVSINYRLLPGVFLSGIVEDVQDAFHWVRNDLAKMIPINPDAIAIWGASAGGGLAAIAGFKLTPRPQALILLYPLAANYTHREIYNPNTPVSEEIVSLANSLRQPIAEGEGVYDSSRMKLLDLVKKEDKTGWIYVTSNPNESPEKILNVLKEYSAVYHIDEDYPPTYLVHGLTDVAVPSSWSTEMAVQLREKGITYEIDLVEDVGHDFNLFASDSVWEKHVLPLIDFAAIYINH